MFEGEHFEHNNDDCLDFYIDDSVKVIDYITEPHQKVHQIIPFCRRGDFRGEPLKVDEDVPKLTFNDLYQRNVTAARLYSWSAHLEIIEEYEAFLQNPINDKTIGESTIFYNCSSKHKFGHFCQYSFNSQVYVSSR